MKTDKETIVKAAYNIIERFGERALSEVDARIEELNRKKQFQAMELWMKIRNEIVHYEQSANKNTLH
jgi:hypothetical protein